MNKFSKKALILLVAAGLLLTCTVSGTMAYLADRTDAIHTTFLMADVATDVAQVNDQARNTSIKISNAEGSIDVYVRAAVIANWVNDAGEIVAPAAVDLSQSLNADAWFLCSSDGYYYHKAPVPAGASTADLLKPGSAIEMTQQEGTGYRLQMTVIHQTIQADGIDTSATPGKRPVELAWGVTVTTVNGVSTISK